VTPVLAGLAGLDLGISAGGTEVVALVWRTGMVLIFTGAATFFGIRTLDVLNLSQQVLFLRHFNNNVWARRARQPPKSDELALGLDQLRQVWILVLVNT
jgi:hypothetical protein